MKTQIFFSLFIMTVFSLGVYAQENNSAAYIYNNPPGEQFLRDWLVCGPFPISVTPVTEAPVFRGRGGIDRISIPINASGRVEVPEVPRPRRGNWEEPQDLQRFRAFDRDLLIDHDGEPYIRPQEGMTHTFEGKEYTWHLYHSNDDLIDFSEAFGDHDYVIAYAYAEVVMPQAKQVLLSVGSDDSCKVWLNGKQIHEFWGGRQASKDEDIVVVDMQEGTNRLLFKVQNGSVDWGMVCRVMDPIQFKEIQSEKEQVGQQRERRERDTVQFANLMGQLVVFIFVIVIIIVIQRVVSRHTD